MKHIRLFSLFFLVVRLALPLDLMACDNLKAIRDTAKTAFDAADSEFLEVSLEVSVVAGALPQVVAPVELPKTPSSNDPSSPTPPLPPPDPPKVPIESIIKSLANPVLKAKFNAAKQTRDKAKIALDSAQFQLDQCLTPEKAACGHDMPGHGRAQYSGCDHWDYTCQEAKHQSRSCPTNADGVSCADGSYRMCTDHTHDYTSNTVEKGPLSSKPATTLACGHLLSDSGWHKLSYYRGCGHTDWHCLGAARHNPAKCPPGTDGELCTVWSEYPGWYYVCDTAHDHKYPSDSASDSSDPKDGNSKPATDGTTDETDGTTNKKSGETDSTEGNSKQMVLAACGIHQIEKGSSLAHSHREVSCPLDGYGNGCDPGSYYACQALAHRHQYPNTPKGFRKVVVCPVASWTNCGGKTVDVHKRTCPAGHTYYECNKTAKTAHEAHTASDAPPKQNTQNPKNNNGDSGSNNNNNGGDSSEGVRKCGHPKSAGGDHSFVSSCSETNSDGETCERTSGYWTCKGHTHKFPEKAPTCSAHSWTDCGGAAGDHDATCNAGHSYYTCNETSKVRHEAHTAPPPPPPPPPPPQEDSGSDSEDDDSDDDDDSEDDSDEEEPVAKCGAHGWTGCGGAAGDHDATCDAGHSYYTCNTTAAERHAKH